MKNLLPNKTPHLPLPFPLDVTPGAIAPESRQLIWQAAELVRSGDLKGLGKIGQELRTRLGRLVEPLRNEPNATDQTFLIERVSSNASMEALTLALMIAVISLCLAGQSHERLALLVEHVGELAELVGEIEFNNHEDVVKTGNGKVWSGPKVTGPHALSWLGHNYITRWVAIHQVYFATMSAAAFAMRMAHIALETDNEDRGLVFIGLSESLIRDGVELFSLTPTGFRYRLILRPYMKSIAPGLSGGQGTEHRVFIQDYQRLIFFESARPSVMAALGTMRGAYALAFDRHRSVCAHAVGHNKGSLKNPNHESPEVLERLKASRTSRCPMHRFLNLFKNHPKK